MAASSGFMIAEAERRFPVRIRIAVLPDGLGPDSIGSRNGSTRMPVPTAER
jgi:hypothetical protein